MMKRVFLPCVIFLFWFLSFYNLGAKETHFTASSGNWSESSNWDNGLPADGDDVYIDENTTCTVDAGAVIPDLNSLIIYGKLDNDDWCKDFLFYGEDAYCSIESGGEFICSGNIEMTNFYVKANGTATVYGSMEIYSTLRVEDDATFYDNVHVENLYFGSEDSPGGGTFGVRFVDPVTVELDMYVGDDYGKAKVVCEKKLTVKGNLYLSDTLTIKDTTTVTNTLEIKSSGGIYTYAPFTCKDFKVYGRFYSKANVVYTVQHILKLGGIFLMDQGTFKMDPPSSVTSALIYPDATAIVNKLIISGQKPTEIADYSGTGSELVVNETLTIESGKTLDANYGKITLYGDFICNGTYTYATSEHPLVTFSKAGSCNLTGNVNFYSLKIQAGDTLQTGNYTPSVSPNSLTENGYLLGHIKCTESISDDNTHSLGNIGCQITNGSALSTVTVTRNTGSTYSNASNSVKRWFTINASQEDNSVTVRFYYTDGELNGNSESTLNIWRYSGGSWTKYEPTTRDASNNYVEGIVSIPANSSDWVLSSASEQSALPVELTSLRAEVNGNIVDLRWETATEENNYGFEIERSSYGGGEKKWETIGFVEGKGNSNSPSQYSYKDYVKESGRYWYRLKQIDNDGSIEYSNEIEVNVKVPVGFKVYQNYPNPFNPATKIRYYLPEASYVKVEIFDVEGERVKVIEEKDMPAGYYERECRAEGLSSGTYFVRFSAKGKKSGIVFTDVKKALLLK